MQDEGAEFFRTTMREFLQGAEATVAELRASVQATMQSLRGLYDYFGEKYDGTDPVRILSLLASFLDLYAKAVKQYQVHPPPSPTPRRALPWRSLSMVLAVLCDTSRALHCRSGKTGRTEH